MSEQKWTGGEWEAVPYRHGYNDGTEYTWAVQTTVKDDSGHDLTVELADWLDESTARLIAAAPALVEALEKCRYAFDTISASNGVTRDAERAITDALRQAKGEDT